MKNLFYFLTLLFILGGCTPEADLASFKQNDSQMEAMQAKKDCRLDIDCSYAFQITEEACLFNLEDVLEQIMQNYCPGATLSWKSGTQSWVTLDKGEEYVARLYVQNCEGLSCLQYAVYFSCEDTCSTDECNYNIDIIEGEDQCEYAITYDCGTELEVDGTAANSIPIGNGVCVSIIFLDHGETRDLTFTTEDGQECSETISCGDVACDCDELEVQALVGQDDNGCCIITLRTVIPPGFDCPYNKAVHSISYIDGPPFLADVIGSGPNWTRFRTCHPVSQPTNLIGTVELFLYGVSVCEKTSEPFSLVGCN